MKVYTKTGDQGTTALFNGDRVLKSSTRIEAYGTLDEANAFLGLMIDKLEAHPKAAELNKQLMHIQKELFSLGSELATPQEDFQKLKLVLIDQPAVKRLENEIDAFNVQLPPLRNFIIPGGDEVISLAHILRTITRRAERRVQSLMETESIRETPLMYLNRLSDWFFIVSRYLSLLLNKPERKWQP